MPSRQAKILTVGPAMNGPGGLSALMRMYRSAFPGFRHLSYSSRRGPLAGLFVTLYPLVALPFMRLSGYSILHVHATTGSFFHRAECVVRFGQKLGFRTVFHFHDEDFDEFLGSVSPRHIETIRRASAVAVLSDSWASFYRDRLGCRRVVTLPNMVGDVRVVRDRSKRRLEEPLRLLYMGKFTSEKGIFDLIRALEPLADKYQGYLQLTVAGSGDSEAVIALIDELKLDRTVRFMGYVESKDKDRLLRLSDVLVLPSYREGMPVGILEAGVYNMACIATSVGAIPDVIEHGVNGYLVDPGRPDQITEAIQYYLDNPQAISSQGREARERISPYLPAAATARFTEFYNSLLSDH